MKPARHLIRRAFNAAAASYDGAAVVQRHTCDTLARCLPRLPAPQKVLDAGCGTGYGLGLLQRHFPRAFIVGLDLAPAMLRRAHPFPGIAADAEQLPLADAAFDLYWSSLTAQWCSLEKMLAEAARILRPGGTLLLSTLAAGTFAEMRRAFAAADSHSHTLPFLAPGSIAPLAAAAGFSRCHVDSAPVVTFHSDVKSLLRTVKAIGANQVGGERRTGMMGRAAWQRVEAAWEAMRQPAGLPLTYDLVYLQATR